MTAHARAGRGSRRVAAGQDVWQRRRPRGGVRRAEAGRLQGAHRKRFRRFAGRAAHRGELRAQPGEGFRALAVALLLPRRRLAAALRLARPPATHALHRTSTTSPSRARWKAWVLLSSSLAVISGRRCWCDRGTALSARWQCLDAVASRSCCFCSQSRPSCTVSIGRLGVYAKALLTTASPVRRLLERARRVRRRARRPGMGVIT